MAKKPLRAKCHRLGKGAKIHDQGAPAPPAACYTRRRKPEARKYLFRSFPPAAGFEGAFRSNVRSLLREFGAAASPPPGPGSRGAVWRVPLVYDGVGRVVPLFVVEEDVCSAPAPCCNHCRCAGWSHHWVSKRRYHFVIPADEDWSKPLTFEALYRYRGQKRGHLLHGVIHCNGFGHLLNVRGRDGGSAILSGRDLMDLWDRLCTALRARAVTVVDVARKRSMELRLLLGAATAGNPWFARWGYKPGTGSFGVSELDYQSALISLSSFPVNSLSCPRIREVTSMYCRHSGKQITTVGDLLRCLLDWKWRKKPEEDLKEPVHLHPSVKTETDIVDLFPRWKTPVKRREQQFMHRAMKGKEHGRAAKNFDVIIAKMRSRWTPDRLRKAAKVVVDALLEEGCGIRMTRQEVRDAARLSVGDTGLLDFVIKLLNNVIVGRHVVRRVPHPDTRVLHFSVEEAVHATGTIIKKEEEDTSSDDSATEEDDTQDDSMADAEEAAIQWPTVADAERDMKLVYHAMVKACPDHVQTVLNCKHWIKKWGIGDDSDDKLRYVVDWQPTPVEAVCLRKRMPPGEVILVPTHASVGDLRSEAESALQDTYYFLEKFRAERLHGVSGEDWEPVLLGGAESGAVLEVSGSGADLNCKLLYEGGSEQWVVECLCGARDDDGERMVACDACDIWQHTRCVGIPDDQPAPRLFLCSVCGNAMVDAGNILKARSACNSVQSPAVFSGRMMLDTAAF